MAHLLVQYFYLQLLDFLTTIAFLLQGVQEANPVVRWLISSSPSPVAGLAAAKLLALALGIAVFLSGRQRLLARVNIFFAAVVAWNLIALIVGSVAAT